MRTALTAAIACLATMGLSQAQDAQASIRQTVSIAAQELATALRSFAQERQLYLIYADQDIASQRTMGVSGELTQDETLQELLSGTNLTYRYLDDKTVTILPAPSGSKAEAPAVPGRQSSPGDPGSDAESNASAGPRTGSTAASAQKGFWQRLRLAQAEQAQTSETSAQGSASNTELVAEITVTAQKREENVQDISVVVDVFTGETLENMGVTTTTDLASLSPGVVISNLNGGSTPTISIRGVGVGGASYFANQPNSAAINIDNVYLPSAIMSNFQIFDLERVEILKGPQGTLFGRNTTAGALNFFSRKPTDEAQGFLSASFSRWNTSRVEAAVGGPLAENVNYRLSLANDRSDGNVDNIFGGDRTRTNGTDRLAYRGQLLFAPSSATDVLLSLHGGRDKSDIFQYQSQPAENPGNPLDRFAYEEPCLSQYEPADIGCVSSSQSQFQSSSAYDGDNFQTNANLTDEADIKAIGGSIQVEHELPGMLLTSITAYDDFSRYYAEDADGGPTTELHIFFDEDFASYSEELRLTSMSESRFQWIGGLYASKLDVEMKRHADFNDLGEAAYGPGGGYGIVYANEIDETSLAAFGHATYELSEPLTLLAGVRYSYEDKEIRVVSANVPGANPVFSFVNVSSYRTPPEFGPQDGSWRNVSGKLGLEYRLGHDALVYGHWSRGFKSGGFPGSIGVRPNRLVPYEPEIVDAYEIGAKTNFASGAGLFNVSAFYLDYQDRQEVAALDDDGTVFDFTNAAAATVYGIEVQFGYSFAFDARLESGLAYLNTEFDDFSTAPFGDASGNELSYAPELTANLQYRQQFELTSTASLELATNISFTDDQFFDARNSKAFSGAEYVLWNARVNFTLRNAGVTASLYAKNILDEEYRAGGTDQATGVYGLTYGDPRTYGIELRKDWGRRYNRQGVREWKSLTVKV